MCSTATPPPSPATWLYDLFLSSWKSIYPSVQSSLFVQNLRASALVRNRKHSARVNHRHTWGRVEWCYRIENVHPPLLIFKSEYSSSFSASLHRQLGSIHLSLYLHSKARRPSIHPSSLNIITNSRASTPHHPFEVPNQTTKDVVGDTNIVISIYLFLIVETVAEELPFDNNPQPAQWCDWSRIECLRMVRGRQSLHSTCCLFEEIRKHRRDMECSSSGDLFLFFQIQHKSFSKSPWQYSQSYFPLLLWKRRKD